MIYNIEINGEVKTVEVKDKQLILILQGCPAAGKSTFANKLVDISKNEKFNKHKFIAVSKDNIRQQLNLNKDEWLNYEKDVTTIEIDQIKKNISDGYSVVIDDMNFDEKFINMWIKIAKEFDIDYQILTLYVPYQEAINRITKRNMNIMPKSKSIKIVNIAYMRYYPDEYNKILNIFKIKTSAKRN